MKSQVVRIPDFQNAVQYNHLGFTVLECTLWELLQTHIKPLV